MIALLMSVCFRVSLSYGYGYAATPQRVLHGQMSRGSFKVARIALAIDWEQGSPYCFWLSKSKALIVSDGDPIRWHNEGGLSTLQAVEVDVNAGVQRYLAPLSEALKREQIFRIEDFSIDRGLLGMKSQSVMELIEIKPDGQVGRKWKIALSGPPVKWIDQGRRWVTAASSEPQMGDEVGGRTDKLKLGKDFDGLEVAGVLNPDELILYRATTWNPRQAIVSPIGETHLHKLSISSRQDHTTVIKFPAAWDVVHVALSPKQNRLAWLIRRRHETDFDEHLIAERHGDKLAGVSNEIWISKLDGSEWRQVWNEVPILLPGEKLTEFPRNLAWLPSEQRLSFLYMRALYLVAIEPQATAVSH